MPVKIMGRNKLRSTVASFKRNVAAGLLDATEAVSDAIVADAKEFCPVDTGSLRESIRRETVNKKGEVMECRVRAGGFVENPKHPGHTVDYASHVEFGTSKNRPQAFLAPAIEKNRQSAEAIEIMKQAVTKAWRAEEE